MLTPIPLARLPAFWPELVTVLTPSLAYDRQRTLGDVARELRDGETMAWRVTGDAVGFALTTTGGIEGEPGRLGFWIAHVGGKVTGKRFSAMRAIVDQFEQMARILGCDVIFIEGRVAPWSRLAPGWHIADSVLRKEL